MGENMVRLKFSGCALPGGLYCRGLFWALLPSSVTLSMSNQLGGGDGRRHQQTDILNMFEGRTAIQKGVGKQEDS